MNWIAFGNVVNIFAALVTIGSPVFSVVRAIVQNKHGRSLNSGKPTASITRTGNSSTANQVNINTVPWYIWVKTIGRSLWIMFEDSPLVILIYPIVGFFGLVVIFIFCFLVNIPTAWMNGTEGARALVLCAVLAFSLHFSVIYAEHTPLFLQEELKTQIARSSQRPNTNP